VGFSGSAATICAFPGEGTRIERIMAGGVLHRGIWGDHEIWKAMSGGSAHSMLADGFEPDWTLLCVKSSLVEDFYLVAGAQGVCLVSPDPALYLERLYNELLPPTREHRSSMQEDIPMGRRTEIDALNGAIWRMADSHGIEAPANMILARMINFLEDSNSGSDLKTRGGRRTRRVPLSPAGPTRPWKRPPTCTARNNLRCRSVWSSREWSRSAPPPCRTAS
jgi:hypothetical protein